MRKLLLLAGVLVTAIAVAQTPQLGPAVRQFVTVDAPVVALTHVQVIDGTGAEAKSDQTVVISGGKVQQIGDAATVPPPAGAQVMDKRGYTVIPGLVGMHDHMFYPEGGIQVYVDLVQGAPPLYLA